MKIFGLDIGTEAIKAVELNPEGSRYRLLHFGMAPMPASLQSEAEKDQQAIASAISKLLSQSGIALKTPVLALPESQVFSRVIEMTPLSEAELKNAIRWEAEQYVPIPLEEASLDYQIIKERVKTNDGVEKMEVFLIAVAKSLIDKYSRVLNLAELQPVAMETELIAISRALLGSTVPETDHRLIISLGSQSSDLAIVQNSQIVYTRSLNTGGQALARAIAKSLNLDLTQAEEYKKSYGLDESKLEGKVALAMKPVFDLIIDEIKKAILFYEEKAKVKLQTALLAGGTVLMPGAVPYLAGSLSMEVIVGDPLKNVIVDDPKNQPALNITPFYTTAIGLAMKKI